MTGLIGAAVGLYIGWLDAKILKGLIQATEMKNREAGGDGGFAARHGALLRGLVYGIGMVGFPIIGYWAGSALTG
ncbi:hypothetical protein [Roseibium sp. RKSG952]|uniref:hypothetical protein n=1 Tax=Roseibium sp. RKSG952 TaxID=2529384 RepID=UPI0012BBD01C|nr:hypothetical protein [Roseibium sp. RKSG952]